MSHALPPRIDGAAPEAAPGTHGHPKPAQGQSGRFHITKTDDPYYPWRLDYPEPNEDGFDGIDCTTFILAVEEFVKETQTWSRRR